MHSKNFSVVMMILFRSFFVVLMCFSPLFVLVRCSNKSTVWSPLVEDTESISIVTNTTYNESRKIHQVFSQVVFLRAQQITVRCQARNERGARARDIRLVTSSKCPGLVCCKPRIHLLL